MTLALNLLAYVVLSTSGLLLLRTGLRDDGGIADLVRDPRVLVGAVLYAASFLTWLFALRRNELSLVYPVFIGTRLRRDRACLGAPPGREPGRERDSSGSRSSASASSSSVS